MHPHSSLSLKPFFSPLKDSTKISAGIQQSYAATVYTNHPKTQKARSSRLLGRQRWKQRSRQLRWGLASSAIVWAMARCYSAVTLPKSEPSDLGRTTQINRYSSLLHFCFHLVSVTTLPPLSYFALRILPPRFCFCFTFNVSCILKY